MREARRMTGPGRDDNNINDEIGHIADFGSLESRIACPN